MKRLIALALTIIMCLSFVACAGPDRQPAIDAFNKAKDAFNEVATTINADIDSYADEVISTMTEMANVLCSREISAFTATAALIMRASSASAITICPRARTIPSSSAKS